jgi:PAS domain S-box-containing protein
MTKRSKILVVDDDSVNTQSLMMVLTEEYDVHTASSGHDAISQLKEQLPDLILLDIMMPDLSGFDVCSIIRSDASFADIPIIFMTALDGIDNELRGLELGAIDYITKPINFVLLTQRVRNHIALKERTDLIKVQRDLLKRHRTVFRATMDGFWLTDTQGRLLEVNETYCQMSGYSEQELLSMRVADLEDKETAGETAAHIQKVFERGEDRFESRHRRKDGTVFYVEVSVQLLPVDEGQFVVFTRDITERKQADADLRFSENRYRAVVNSQTEFVNRYSQGGILTFVNDALCSYLGEKPEKVLGLSFFPFVYEDDRDELIWSIETLNINHPTYLSEYRLVLRDGTIRWHQWAHTAIFNSEGVIVEYQSVGRDVTARKHIEEALKESETRFRYVMENIKNVAVQGYALDGTVLFWNRAAELLYGYTTEEALGANLLDLIIPVEMREGVIEAVRQMVESGEPIPAGELLLKRKDNSLVPVFSNHTLIHPHGRAPELFCMDLDLTERTQIEEENIELMKQLQQSQKLESLGVLAGGIAHDFNNILAIIVGNCFMAKQRPEVAEKHITTIEKASERAAELCRQMLAYAGKSKFIETQINSGALVDEMVNMLNATINQNVALKYHYTADIPLIVGDASQLRQIVMNLIINAAEAIGEAQGEVLVTLAKKTIVEGHGDKDHLGKVIPAGLYVCLEVTDNGCGMDSETRHRIFEPFYTTKFTGRGLGMSATLGIITAHKGALQLRSQEGLGTVFMIYLPVQSDEATGTESLQQLNSVAWRGAGTILLVEDEAQLTLILKTMLKKLGFTVIDATNGREALTLYQQHADEIALVVTDIGMPIMDGYELFSELKKIKAELPIIISSGFGENVITARIAREEIAGLISKPYSFELLSNVLKSVVEDTQEENIKVSC